MSVRPNRKDDRGRPINHSTTAFRVEIPQSTAAKTAGSDAFIQACASKGVEPTKRQAAKYNARQGRWA